MNGLISDQNMVLSSLNKVSVEALSSRNHVECFEGGATYDISHDVVCVALETNFQYISFERGRQVAVFDIAVIDSSLILPGSDTSSNYVLRLYGSAALTASIGSSRVTRGTILFLNQCYSNITFKNKNELTINNPEKECVETEDAALLQSRCNATSLLQPPTISVPPSVLSSLPLPHMNMNENLLNMKKEVSLKLRPSTGSIHLLIANGTDCVGRGMCRGAYPNLYRQADILSVWCEQNSSLLLSRLVPVRSVYVPGLREAFGFNLIDIVLDHSMDPFRHGENIRRNNIICGTLDKSKNKIGINEGLVKEMDENKEKEKQKESSGRAVHQTDVTCPEIYVKLTETETKNTKPSLSEECSSKELSLRMTDSAGTSVKLQFHSMDQLNHVLQLLHSASSSTSSQRTTVPILFKSVTVKSLFSNSVTCLQATELSKFAIFECCDFMANNPSVVECTWSELRSLANGHSCRPTHDGEGMGMGMGKGNGKVKESGQAVGEREGKGKGEGGGEGEGGVLELNGHRLLPVHRGKLLSVQGTLLHVIFAADRSSIKRDCLNMRNRNRGRVDRHRQGLDYVGDIVIGGKDQRESDVKSESTGKNIMKVQVTDRGSIVEDDAEGCVSDKSAYSIDKCKNGYVQRFGNCVEKVQTVGGIDGEVEDKENGVGPLKEGEELRQGEGVRQGEGEEVRQGGREGVREGEVGGEGADDDEERENDDIFMQALVSITRLSDDEYEFRSTSDNQWTARTKAKAKAKTNEQHTPKKQKRDNEVGLATAATGGECALSIRYKEARFIIGPPSVSVAHVSKIEGMDVHRNFYRSESDSSYTDQSKAIYQYQYQYQYQCKNKDKTKNKFKNGNGNENKYCSQNNESLHDTVSSTQPETDFIIASVYDEEIQKLFGNISAKEVAVSCTRNRELEIQKLFSKQLENKNKNRSRGRGRDCEVKNGNKMEEEEGEEVKNNGNLNMDGARMNPPSSSLCLASTSASASHSRRLNESHVGKAEHNRKMHFCQNSEIEQLLHRLPSFDYSESCARTVDSLIKSSYKKEQYTFLLRLNQFVDDNGIRISGGRSALSLEGILPST